MNRLALAASRRRRTSRRTSSSAGSPLKTPAEPRKAGCDARPRFRERQLVSVPRLARAAACGDIARGESAPAQAFAVGSVRLRRIPRGGDKRRHILQYDRARGDHGVGADAAELMYPDESSQHRMIADYDVAGELRIVRKRGVVTDDAIMRDMAIRQYPVSVTDRRRAAVERGPGVNGHELADDVVVADLGRGRLAAVLSVLRNLADRRELDRKSTRLNSSHR